MGFDDQINVRLNPLTADLAHELARLRGCSVSALVRGFVLEALRREMAGNRELARFAKEWENRSAGAPDPGRDAPGAPQAHAEAIARPAGRDGG